MKKVMSETNGAVFSLPWYVAKDEGLFAEEGIEMEFVHAHAVIPEHNTDNHEDVDPILGHIPFEEQQVTIYRA
jgi:NitT/TauT family transport system substrate-binding protein